MSIVILGDLFSFPEGDAATNRVHTYAKGFCENGHSVHVICFGNVYDSDENGVFDGIFFYHPFGQTERNRSFFVRTWQKFIKYCRTISILRRINKNDKISALNCVTDHIIATLLFTFILSKIFNFIVILERSEHPLRNYQTSSLRKIRGNIKAYLEARFCDGILCISQYLIEFYRAKGVRAEKLLLVPSTVDTERFKTLHASPLTFQYILYCGSLTVVKDGLDILIESFGKISDKYPDINLVIIGRGDTIEEEMIFKNLVIKLNLSRKVFFPGYLPRTEIPAYLVNAKILTLARPTSIVSAAGFPSKVTEYLATGVPLVVTEVGDIPVYLKDGENAFITKPDSADSFADKLDFVLGNYQFAKEIAKKGRQLTNTTFNYKYQAERIIEFIKSLS